MNESLATLEQRVAALEAKLAALQTSTTRIVAPVEVVDADGQLLLTIQRERNSTSLSLYNAAGQAVAILGVESMVRMLAISPFETLRALLSDVSTLKHPAHVCCFKITSEKVVS